MVKVYIDGHVHIYACFDLDNFFAAALENFHTASGPTQDGQHPLFFLLLAESETCNWFHRLCSAEGGDLIGLRNWQVNRTAEDFVLRVNRTGERREGIYLVAGRQVVTREKLEVLSLLCGADISGGLSLADTVDHICAMNGLAVLPWGAGKWLGSRGKVLRRFCAERKSRFFWGDNGGRPSLWPTPELLRSAKDNTVGILSGTDPLPIPAEVNRVGSFGSSIFCELPEDTPGASLKRILVNEFSGITPFGRKMANNVFLRNQFKLYLHRKRS